MRIGMLGMGAVLIAGAAQGAVYFYDLDGGDQAAFDAAVAGLMYHGSTTFDAAPDWGIAGMDAPVDTNTNNGFITPGMIQAGLVIQNNINPWGFPDANNGGGINTLVAVGASGGFGNPSNSLLANYFVDAFDIIDDYAGVVAIEIDALTLLGSDVVDLSLYDDGGNQTNQWMGLSAPAAGHRYGIVVDGGDSIGRLNVYDSFGGAEGVMNITTWQVPAPGALALLGLAGLAGRRRR